MKNYKNTQYKQKDLELLQRGTETSQRKVKHTQNEYKEK